MLWRAGAQQWFAWLAVGRHRRLLLACLISLLVSGVLLGLIGLTRWRGQRALETDTRSVIQQTGQQLVRALNSRRGTLTFIRDTLNRRADLTGPQLQAMGTSAVEHTRHLLGVGLVRTAQAPEWWSGPSAVSRAELADLNHAMLKRTEVRGTWRVPSTFTTRTATQRSFLIMLEPLRASSHRRSAIVGVFDIKPLLEDFFASSLSQWHPVQLFDGEVVLYQSSDWPRAAGEPRPIIPPPLSASVALLRSGAADQGVAARPPAGSLAKRGRGIIEEHRLALDTARWTLQMQPGNTHVIRTLSWLNVLLISLSVIAGLGVTIIVWLLAARTWILQRVINRRTAALRRTLKRLRQMAITDDLTGLHNRRFFLDRWEWECERAKRYKRPLACLMIDVNGFKQVNDRLGHHAGDLILKQVAQELTTALRQSDILARFGGDEFIIALPETSFAQANAVAEKLRHVSIPVPGRAEHRLSPISLSVGISRVEQDDESPLEILQAADQSLYASKHHQKESIAHSAVGIPHA